MDSLKLQCLGRAVGEVSDSMTPAEAEDEIRAELIRRLAESPGKSISTKRFMWLPLVAVCLGTLAFFTGWTTWLAQQDQAISFSEGGKPGIKGRWMATEGDLRTLKFSEGSFIELQPKTRLRVNSLAPKGAELLLERGTAHADFVPRREARWLLLAGPFSVQVTGTRFELTWVPESGKLLLKMTEGAVIVEGPTIGEPRRVVGGEELKVSLSENSVHVRPHEGVELALVTPDEAEAVIARTRSAPDQGESADSITEPRARGDQVHRPAQNEGDASGKGPQNLDSRARGLDYWDENRKLKFAQASAGELLALADEARLSGRSRLARDALLQARRMHGVRSSTAYLLGKVAADQIHDTEDAARWFEVYLQEEPQGPLREQALGRLLGLGHGDSALLRERARAYLEDYSTGAYAPLARNLVGAAELPQKANR